MRSPGDTPTPSTVPAIAGDDADLYRAVLASLPAHVAVLDADGVIITTNDGWDRFARDNRGADGAASGAALPGACGVGTNYLDVCRRSTGVDSREASAVAEGIRAVLDGSRDEFRIEYPCHAPDRQRWFLKTVTPLALLGGQAEGGRRRRGVVVSHFDITDRVRAELSLKRRAAEYKLITRRLKKSNEELDQFAYITSHDLRAPLRGIANLSRWIEEDLADRFTPEAHRQMELLRGRVHRMEAMIDGILEYSRVGRVRHHAERVDTAKLVAEVIDLLDVPARFTVEVAAGMPVVFGERLRLQQVFQNLIGNAVKYHDKPAGRIAVDWRDAETPAGADAGHGWVEFSVADDGPGIEPQYHDRIFVIFQTLEARDKVEGTGVGLSLVRKIVESQCGTVRVESDKGRGATFRFTWPRRHGAAGPAGGAARGGTAPDLKSASAPSEE